jgi:hypothetical protein
MSVGVADQPTAANARAHVSAFLNNFDQVDECSAVMAGLVPAIHALAAAPKTWMRGTSPRMTERDHCARAM